MSSNSTICPRCGGKKSYRGKMCWSCRTAPPDFIDNNDGTVSIPLTSTDGIERFAIIDRDDIDLVVCHKWFAFDGRPAGGSTFYAHATINKKTTRMHRLILGASASELVDHENRDGLDNRRSNIRKCTSQENSRNKQRQRSGTSRFKGVSWNRKNKTWIAQISNNLRCQYLESFKDEENAAMAYDRAARELHGVFGRYNFPSDGEMSAI